VRVRLSISIESDAGQVEVRKEVVTVKRKKQLTPARLGLGLAESKQILHEVQQIMVAHQTADYGVDQQKCAECGTERKRRRP
jgi:hypothetical protein